MVVSCAGWAPGMRRGSAVAALILVVGRAIASDADADAWDSGSCAAGSADTAGHCKPVQGHAMLQSRSKAKLAASSAADDSAGTAAAMEAATVAVRESLRAGGRIAAQHQAARAMQRMQHKMTQYGAHEALMRRTMEGVNQSYGPSNKELDHMMRKFEDSQAASQDKCPALLLESKHHMNALMAHIHELSVEISNMEKSLVATTQDLTTTYTMHNHTNDWRYLELMKCKKRQELDFRMYWTLKEELLEMHQIANPSYKATIDYTFKPDIGPAVHTIHTTTTSGGPGYNGGGSSSGNWAPMTGGYGPGPITSSSTGYGGSSSSTGYGVTSSSSGYGVTTTTSTGSTTTTSTGGSYGHGGGGYSSGYGSGSGGISGYSSAGYGYSSSTGYGHSSGYGGYGSGSPVADGAGYKPPIADGDGYKPPVADGTGYRPPVADGAGYKPVADGYDYKPSDIGLVDAGESSVATSADGLGSQTLGGYYNGGLVQESFGAMQSEDGPNPFSSLLQQKEAVHPGQSASAAVRNDDKVRGSTSGARQLVQQTKQLAAELKQCMSYDGSEVKHPAFLQEIVSESDATEQNKEAKKASNSDQRPYDYGPPAGPDAYPAYWTKDSDKTYMKPSFSPSFGINWAPGSSSSSSGHSTTGHSTATTGGYGYGAGASSGAYGPPAPPSYTSTSGYGPSYSTSGHSTTTTSGYGTGAYTSGYAPPPPAYTSTGYVPTYSTTTTGGYGPPPSYSASTGYGPSYSTSGHSTTTTGGYGTGASTGGYGPGYSATTGYGPSYSTSGHSTTTTGGYGTGESTGGYGPSYSSTTGYGPSYSTSGHSTTTTGGYGTGASTGGYGPSFSSTTGYGPGGPSYSTSGHSTTTSSGYGTGASTSGYGPGYSATTGYGPSYSTSGHSTSGGYGTGASTGGYGPSFSSTTGYGPSYSSSGHSTTTTGGYGTGASTGGYGPSFSSTTGYGPSYSSSGHSTTTTGGYGTGASTGGYGPSFSSTTGYGPSYSTSGHSATTTAGYGTGESTGGYGPSYSSTTGHAPSYSTSGHSTTTTGGYGTGASTGGYGPSYSSTSGNGPSYSSSGHSTTTSSGYGTGASTGGYGPSYSSTTGPSSYSTTTGYGPSSTTGYGPSSAAGSSSSTGYGPSSSSTYSSTTGPSSYSSTTGYGPSSATGYGSTSTAGYGSSTAAGYGGPSFTSGYGSSSGYGPTYHSSAHSKSQSSAHKTSHSSRHVTFHSSTGSSSSGLGSTGAYTSGSGSSGSGSGGVSSGTYTSGSGGSGSGSGSGGYAVSSGGFPGASDACQYQKRLLQAVYIKAYVEITRLVAEYEVLIHGHNCEDWVFENEGEREKVLKEKQQILFTTIHSWEMKLQAYKVRIQEAYQAEFRLRAHIKELTTRCQQMDATISSLDKVRDAIHIMGTCPGLGPINFRVPTWTHVWKEAWFDTVNKPDSVIDQEMNVLCQPESSDDYEAQTTPAPGDPTKVYRAAESSEIMLKTLDGVPGYNSAGIPLMGACPNCEGDADDGEGPVHVSHHARVCWDPDAYLVTSERRMDCNAGRKAVLCVEDYKYPSTSPVEYSELQLRADAHSAKLPAGCTSWFDGCHTCHGNQDGNWDCSNNDCSGLTTMPAPYCLGMNGNVVGPMSP